MIGNLFWVAMFLLYGAFWLYVIKGVCKAVYKDGLW